jgi:hypothetical protein
MQVYPRDLYRQSLVGVHHARDDLVFSCPL